MAVSFLLALSGLGGWALQLMGSQGGAALAHVGADGEGTLQPGFPKNHIKNTSKTVS